MRTLYLHIGTPKTATTSIQMFCVDNESVLKKLGYSYPILNFKFPKVEKRRNGHFLVGGTKKADGTKNIEKDEQLKQYEQLNRKFLPSGTESRKMPNNPVIRSK